MHPRRLPFVGALVFSLCLLISGCASDSPTSDDRTPGPPLLDGPGWIGGGGRMPGDTTSTSNAPPPDSTPVNR